MAINKYMKMALKAMSYAELDITKSYKLKRQVNNITNPNIVLGQSQFDYTVTGLDGNVPVRVFMPKMEERKNKLLIFFHGGGWVVGNIDTYSKACQNMASLTGCIVVSVDYRLAPEYKFPLGLKDCYLVTQALLADSSFFGIHRKDIILIGDSAGGNLAAAVSLMARDKGGIIPHNQILIYPALWNDHTEESPYESVRDRGAEYLLTSQRLCDYMELYTSNKEDLQSPYLAPLLEKDLSNQPRTLIITAEYDPLRDEGEDYGERLKQAENDVTIYRMKDALHGFIALPKRFVHVKRAYEQINAFLLEVGNEKKETIRMD